MNRAQTVLLQRETPSTATYYDAIGLAPSNAAGIFGSRREGGSSLRAEHWLKKS